MHNINWQMKILFVLFILIFTPLQEALASKSSYFQGGNFSRPITLTFVGDVNLGEKVAPQIRKNSGNGFPFRYSSNFFRNSDLSFANLECVLSTSNQKSDKKFTFKGDPFSAQLLKNSGIDVVSLANNHTLDYGRVSLIHTISSLKEHGIFYAGAGETLEESLQPASFTTRYNRIALLAVTDIIPAGFPATNKLPGVAPARPEALIVEAISKASENHDLTIVFVHWGIERNILPSKKQEQLAHKMIEAGADLIVGSHPHVWQPLEIYRNRLIVYSLGNFVFNPGNREGRYTGLLQLELLPTEIEVKIYPYYISTTGEPVRADTQYRIITDFLDSVIQKSNFQLRKKSGKNGTYFEAKLPLEHALRIKIYRPFSLLRAE